LTDRQAWLASLAKQDNIAETVAKLIVELGRYRWTPDWT
jgi:hypothetical protein